MKSFPSTINEARSMYGNGQANSYSKIFDIDRLTRGALNLNQSVPVIKEQLNEHNINISNFQAYQNMSTMPNPGSFIVTGSDTGNYYENEADAQADAADLSAGILPSRYQRDITVQEEKIYFENPLQMPAEIIALAKDYDWSYRYMSKSFVNTGEKSGESLKVSIANTAVAPSMFNPLYGVSVLGIIRNTPLLNDLDDPAINQKISDCSIRMLCALSKHANSELGMARYKYSDFMYCKDLGKVPNNHMITLRRFAHPIGDHIFEMATPKHVKSSGDLSFETEGDVGRLITWFGTDDNKLEDIIKFSYHATWKHLEAKIEEKDSVADDPTSGIVGMISNSFSPVYNKATANGQAGTHSIWGWLGSKLTPSVFQGIGKNNDLLRNYDNNKVYTPKNTIWENHIYEGKLEFTHEFTLNFSYKLRAYDNINPRSAFLDLIGNILEVTYRRGKFWGGDRKIIGPPQDQSTFRKVNNYIDEKWDKMGNMFNSLSNGNYNLNSILGSMKNGANNLLKQVYDNAKDIMQNGKNSEYVTQLTGWMKNIFSGSAAPEAIKGYIKNAMGRPTAFAWQSLVDGSANGLWHVTIGNPRNPIMAIGNLIMTDASITQSGPLGIDDFPTELRVTVSLKHCTPRDATDIGRMYTKGAAAIYHVLAHNQLKDFFDSKSADGAVSPEEATQKKEYDLTSKTATKEAPKQDATVTTPATDRNDLFIAELDKTSKGSAYYNNADIDSAGLPNPLLLDEEHILITRKNNYSDYMLRTSMEEVA